MQPTYALETEMHKLKPVCFKKRQKSPNQETGLVDRDRGSLDALNDTELILKND